MRFFTEFILSRKTRFFAEFILSHTLRFFALLRMTKGEGLRMTSEGFRMTKKETIEPLRQARRLSYELEGLTFQVGQPSRLSLICQKNRSI